MKDPYDFEVRVWVLVEEGWQSLQAAVAKFNEWNERLLLRKTCALGMSSYADINPADWPEGQVSVPVANKAHFPVTVATLALIPGPTHPYTITCRELLAMLRADKEAREEGLKSVGDDTRVVKDTV